MQKNLAKLLLVEDVRPFSQADRMLRDPHLFCYLNNLIELATLNNVVR